MYLDIFPNNHATRKPLIHNMIISFVILFKRNSNMCSGNICTFNRNAFGDSQKRERSWNWNRSWVGFFYESAQFFASPIWHFSFSFCNVEFFLSRAFNVKWVYPFSSTIKINDLYTFFVFFQGTSSVVSHPKLLFWHNDLTYVVDDKQNRHNQWRVWKVVLQLTTHYGYIDVPIQFEVT